MIVAPNSPSARAQAITSPAASAGAASAGGADEERRSHERLGDDHRDGAEGDAEAHGRQRPAQDSLPAEDEQKREPGDRGREDDRQVDQGLEEHGTARRTAGQKPRDGQPEQDREPKACLLYTSDAADE